MELTDLMPMDQWVALEKEICRRFDIDANVFNIKGIRITDHKEWKNKLCPAIKATDKGQSFICAVAHMNLAAMASKTRLPVVEECDAGLLKMVVPVFVDDNFLGAVCGCGILPEGGEVESFLVNKITEIDTDEVEQLAEGIRQISQGEIDAFVAFAQQQIEQITSERRNNA